jgi:hypothetical protein
MSSKNKTSYYPHIGQLLVGRTFAWSDEFPFLSYDSTWANPRINRQALGEILLRDKQASLEQIKPGDRFSRPTVQQIKRSLSRHRSSVRSGRCKNSVDRIQKSQRSSFAAARRSPTCGPHPLLEGRKLRSQVASTRTRPSGDAGQNRHPGRCSCNRVRVLRRACSHIQLPRSGQSPVN